MLDDLKMIHAHDPTDALGMAEKQCLASGMDGAWMQGQVAAWRPEVPTHRNAAKQLAQELMGRAVVVRGAAELTPAIDYWQRQLDLCAWTPAWAGQPKDRPFSVIEVCSSGQVAINTADHTIVPAGATLAQQLLWTRRYADFVGIYLALLHGLDSSVCRRVVL